MKNFSLDISGNKLGYNADNMKYLGDGINSLKDSGI